MTWYRPTSLAEAQKLAQQLAKSRLTKLAEADILTVALAGAELGLDFYASMRSFHILHGTIVPSAQLIAGLALRHKQCEYFREIESSDQRVIYEAKRAGCEPVRREYTIDHARAAGLLKNPTWKRFPAAMLRARCAASLARSVFPDAITGLDQVVEFEADETPETRQPGKPASQQPGKPATRQASNPASQQPDKRRVSEGTVPIPLEQWADDPAPDSQAGAPQAPDFDPVAAEDSGWREAWLKRYQGTLLRWTTTEELTPPEVVEIGARVIAARCGADQDLVARQLDAKWRSGTHPINAWANAELYYRRQALKGAA